MGAVINSKLILALSISLIFSCGETEQIGDKLSASEIEYLRLRAARKCINETNEDYADFISSSNSAFIDYERNENQWKYVYKYNSAVTRTHKVFVWKKTSTAVYFRILTDETTPKNIYLKFSKTANNDLMRSVQEDDCAQGDYEASASSSSVSLRNNDENAINDTSTTSYRFFRTYAYSSSLPGFFGNLSLTLKRQNYNDKDEVTTSTTDLYEFTAVTPEEQPSDVYTAAEYGTQPTRYYCIITSANPVGTATYRRYTVVPTDILNPTAAGNNITCDNSSDTPTVTLGTESFTPGTELIF